MDSVGNIYVADTGYSIIREITPAGVVSTLTARVFNTGTNDGAGADAQFNVPSGVAVDSKGNLYVADTYNCTIRKITAAGVVTTLVGQPQFYYIDGNAIQVPTLPAPKLDHPLDVLLLPSRLTHRVGKITAAFLDCLSKT